MPLIHRFTRLFTADINAVLDRIEEPEVLARQAVREMDAELASMQARMRILQQDRERAAERECSEREQLAALDEELDICFAAGEDQLARNLVRRKLEANKRERAAANRRANTEKELGELEQCVAESREKLAAMREMVELLVDDPADDRADGNAECCVAGEEIEIAFLREKQRRARS